MAETVTKIFVNIGSKEYEFDGGGYPAPDSVGTEQLIDGSVEEQDLHDDVRDRMTITHDSSTGGLRLGGYAKPGEIPANSSGEFNEPVEVEEGD